MIKPLNIGYINDRWAYVGKNKVRLVSGELSGIEIYGMDKFKVRIWL